MRTGVESARRSVRRMWAFGVRVTLAMVLLGAALSVVPVGVLAGTPLKTKPPHAPKAPKAPEPPETTTTETTPPPVVTTPTPATTPTPVTTSPPAATTPTTATTPASAPSTANPDQPSSAPGAVRTPPAGGFDSAVEASGTTTAAPAGNRAPLRRLSPFPAIRIRGRLVRGGAVVMLFTVTAPRLARIWVRCAGSSCPRRSYAVYARELRTRIHPFEGFLRAGTRLTVRISRPGYVGKFSSFLIRAQQAPVRHDLCLMAVGAPPVGCPPPTA